MTEPPSEPAQAAETAEATFRAVFEHAMDAILISSADGRLVEANPAVERVLGVERERLIGRLPEELVPAHRHGLLDEIRRNLRERGRLRGDYAFETASGERRWLEYAATADFLPGHDMIILRDCTESRRTQAALAAQTAQEAAIAELGLVALRRAGADGLMRDAVARVAATLSVEHVAILQHPADGAPPRLRAGVRWCDSDAALHDAPSGVEVPIRSREVAWGSLEIRSASSRQFGEHDVDFLQAVANTLGMAVDASRDDEELRRRSAEIARLAADRQRIVAEALAAEDRARERISQQLHDELLQSLFVIRQDLAEVAAGSARADELLQRACDGVHAAIRGLREAVFDIHPVVLERGGLRAAVEAVARHHARLGGFEVDVAIQPDCDGEHDRLLLSLVRELLSNVARHAGAARATVRLRRAAGEVKLEVSDDGRGIDLDEAQLALARGHIGLASAAQRVEALGGRFELERATGRQTTVRAVIPLSAPPV